MTARPEYGKAAEIRRSDNKGYLVGVTAGPQVVHRADPVARADTAVDTAGAAAYYYKPVAASPDHNQHYSQVQMVPYHESSQLSVRAQTDSSSPDSDLYPYVYLLNSYYPHQGDQELVVAKRI